MQQPHLKVAQKHETVSPPPIHPHTLNQIQHIVKSFHHGNVNPPGQASTPSKAEATKPQPKVQVDNLLDRTFYSTNLNKI